LPFLIIALVSVGALGGCAPIERQARSDDLKSFTRQYAQAMRWGQFEVAYSFHRPESGEIAPVDFSTLRNLRFTRYRVLKLDAEPEALDAEVSVAYAYYDEYVGRVSEHNETQRWWYDMEAERWWLDAPFPELR
jgi:hypothetical protein